LETSKLTIICCSTSDLQINPTQILSKTCERLNQLGTGKAEYICGDISSKAGCTELCDKLKKKFEKIHVLVNNSGTAVSSDFHHLPEKGMPSSVLWSSSSDIHNQQETEASSFYCSERLG
jgi:NAD(P)-dependent dehydrogenase (short-subunit alcohol dehydrogenase family)